MPKGTSSQEDIDTVLKEKRLFKPSKAFQKQAHIPSLAAYEALCRKARKDAQKYWAGLAKETLAWFKPWKKTLVWNPPFAEWFVGGLLNVSFNCLDRHLSTWRRNKAALLWEGEDGARRTLTYQ